MRKWASKIIWKDEVSLRAGAEDNPTMGLVTYDVHRSFVLCPPTAPPPLGDKISLVHAWYVGSPGSTECRIHTDWRTRRPVDIVNEARCWALNVER